MPRKVYVYNCEFHGEFEFTEEVEEAHCPKCGAKMVKTGEYSEE
jgi:Zn finger protein HypA/HybF involved in hydrogenase expression